MDTTPPRRGTGQEIVFRAFEAGLGSVPLVGNALAVTFVTSLGWRLEERRERWFTQLAEELEELGDKVDGFDLEPLVGSDLFVDAVVSATRTVEHTHNEEKLQALRDAVLKSAVPGGPDADTQMIMLNLVDRFTASHLCVLTLWDDPPVWFTSHSISWPSMGSRALTVEAALPKLQGRRDFTMLIASELKGAGLLIADLAGMVSPQGMMERLTTNFGRQLVRFISPPEAG